MAAGGVRRANPDDVVQVATLLHDFNVEFDTPSPGADVLARRLEHLLAGGSTLALLAGEPAVGVALVTLRPNVWYDGPVALLDELYVVPARRGRGHGEALLHSMEREVAAVGAELVEINVDDVDHDARRFYERHGYSAIEPDTGEHALYYWRSLAD